MCCLTYVRGPPYRTTRAEVTTHTSRGGLPASRPGMWDHIQTAPREAEAGEAAEPAASATKARAGIEAPPTPSPSRPTAPATIAPCTTSSTLRAAEQKRTAAASVGGMLQGRRWMEPELVPVQKMGGPTPTRTPVAASPVVLGYTLGSVISTRILVRRIVISPAGSITTYSISTYYAVGSTGRTTRGPTLTQHKRASATTARDSHCVCGPCI